jgi:hypothetical protein
LTTTDGAIASKIRYLASCHEADNRETGIADLFHEDVRHLHFLEGTEVLLSGLQDGAAVPAEAGLAALEEASAYRRERSLVYAAFVLAGSMGRRLAAPLLYYPASLHRAEVEGQEVVLLRASISDANLNFPVLAELLGEKNDDALESILRRIPACPFLGDSLSELIQILADFFPRVDASALYRYPKLLSDAEVRRAQRGSGIACLPAAAMALIENPRGSRGVLSELARVAASERRSAPLEALFESAPAAAPGSDVGLASIPATLSRSQQKVLQSARRHPLTLVVGPPGTGKSYTVGALALEHVARGDSVLVACRTEQALDVIEKKLESMLGQTTPVLRGGAKDYTRELKNFLARLLSGGLEIGEVSDASRERPEKRLRRLRACDDAIAALERRLAKRNRMESRRGELWLHRHSSGLAERLHHRFLDWRLSREAPSWELAEELESLESKRIAEASAFFESSRRTRIESLLRKHRAELKRFSDAIRARTSARQDALFEEANLPVLLGAFPLWLSTFRELHRLLPLVPELFDLVIVDEATQSDMASALPALYRARRAAITGDPRQLRHVSFLSRERQRLIGEEHGLSGEEIDRLDYRERSLLDLLDGALASQDQVAFLDEHFRSMPQIIAFSNREFYGGNLRVMTSRPGTLRRRAIELRHVSGSRDEHGVNSAEAEALMAEVAAWVERERGISKSLCHSIGILSPFRDQVELLLATVTRKLDAEAIEKHDVLVSTAYGFQGEERDVMFLSLAVDAKSHPQAMRHLNQPDVFNVAITRARVHQLLFVSVSAEDCPRESLLARYLSEAARDPSQATLSSSLLEDAFLEEVAERLKGSGFRAYPAFPVAGMTVDLLVEKEGEEIGIDLVGHPGRFAPAIDLERYRMFRRAGLRILPLPFSSWQAGAHLCVEAIEKYHLSRRNRPT